MNNDKQGNMAILLAMLVSVFGIVSTALGIFQPNIYGALVDAGALSEHLLYGSIGQDIIMLGVSVMLLVLSLLYLRQNSVKLLVAILGIIWCEFYAFGLYTIQGQYTIIYPLYLAIFGLSIFCLIIGTAALSIVSRQNVKLSWGIKKSVVLFLFFIVGLMVPIWILRMVPSLASHIQDETYGVFVLDLGIVFPAIVVIAVMLIRGYTLAVLLAGIALMKIFALCLSWAFAEIYVAQMLGNPISLEMLGMSSLFTLLSLLLGILYFRKVEV